MSHKLIEAQAKAIAGVVGPLLKKNENDISTLHELLSDMEILLSQLASRVEKLESKNAGT